MAESKKGSKVKEKPKEGASAEASEDEDLPQVKITGKIDEGRIGTCVFAVEHPLYLNKAAFFLSPEKGKGHPLAEALFALPGISELKIAGGSVRITKTNNDDWRTASGPIAKVIRRHIKSGQPAVSEDYKDERMPDHDIGEKVKALLKADINPGLASHGGFADLVEVTAGSVYVTMGGGCQGCGMAAATLRQGIETQIREQIPDVDEVIDATNHSAGTNPYYK